MTDFFLYSTVYYFCWKKKTCASREGTQKKKRKKKAELLSSGFFYFFQHTSRVCFRRLQKKKRGEDIRSAVKSALFRCPAFNDLLLYLFLSVLFVYSFFFLSLRIAEQATNTNEKSKNIFRNTLTASTRRSKKPWRKQERRVPNRGCCEFQQ